MVSSAADKELPLLGSKKGTVGSPLERCEHILADVSAALMAVLLSCLAQIGYAGVIAAGDGLGQHFRALVQQSIAAQGMGTFVYLCSAFRTHAATDSLAANFMLQGAAITGSHFTKLPALQAGHAMLLMSFFTLAFGLLTYLLGRVRFGFILRFIPYTVTGGLVGGFGLITVNIALSLAWGSTAEEAWQATLQGAPLPSLQTLGTVAMALMTTLAPKNPLSTPVILLGTTFAFHCLPESVTADPGWYLKFGAGSEDPSGAADSVTVWNSMLLALFNFHPRAIFNADSLRLFVTFFGVIFIDWGVHLPAMDKIVNKHSPKPLDLDREIKVMGVANIFVGSLGGQPVSHALQIPITVQSFGRKAWPLLTGVLLLVLAVTDGWTVARWVPRFVFAGLMMVSGILLVREWLIASRSRIAPNEWYMLVLTAIIVWVDALLGLVVGLCLALAFSMVEYIGISGIKQRGTLADIHSAVERSPSEERILKAQAERVQIFWLYGYLFFGSIAKAVDEIGRAADAGARWIVVDLALVPAIDAAGVYGLVDLADHLEGNGVMLILTGMVRRLGLAVENAGGAVAAATLDFGLQRVEDAILKASSSDISPSSLSGVGMKDAGDVDEAWALASSRLGPNSSWIAGSEAPWRKVAAVSTIRTEGAGTLLFKEGDAAAELLILLEGTVQLEVWPKEAHMMCGMPRWHLNEKKGDHFVFEDHPQRLRVTSRPGSVINPAECMYAMVGKAATAQFTARTLTHVSVISVPFAGLTDEIKEGFLQQWAMRALASWLSPPEEPSVAPLALTAPLGLSRALSMM